MCLPALEIKLPTVRPAPGMSDIVESVPDITESALQLKICQTQRTGSDNSAEAQAVWLIQASGSSTLECERGFRRWTCVSVTQRHVPGRVGMRRRASLERLAFSVSIPACRSGRVSACIHAPCPRSCLQPYPMHASTDIVDRPSPFCALPDDVLLSILTHLPVPAILRLRQVSLLSLIPTIACARLTTRTYAHRPATSSA